MSSHEKDEELLGKSPDLICSLDLVVPVSALIYGFLLMIAIR